MTELINPPSTEDGHAALQRENDQLREALTSRPEIEQAKGILMAVHGCDATAAFGMLVHESQIKNVKLHEVALRLLDRVQTGDGTSEGR